MHSNNFDEHNKFKFRILVPTGPKSIIMGGKFNEHIFGTTSDELRKEWLFALQVIISY